MAVVLTLLVGAYWLVQRVTSQRARQMVASVLGLPSDSLVQIASTRFNPLTGTFTARGIEVTVDSIARGRRTRYFMTLNRIRMDGIRVRSLLRRDYVVRRATLEAPQLEARLDRRHGSPPTSGDAALPHGILRRLAAPFAIDTIVVRQGSIRYWEIADDGSRPGRLTFDRIQATITNVTNDSTRMTDSARAVIDVTMRIAGVGPVRAIVHYHLLAEDLTLAYRGSIGRMPGRAYNAVLENLEGIRVNSGTLDSAWFAVDVRDNVARGDITVLHHDLSINVMNKVTHEQSLGDHLRTFLGATFKLVSANPAEPEAAVRSVALRQRLDPQSSLFRFMWVTLREGLTETLGL